jgi:hypothetical protein
MRQPYKNLCGTVVPLRAEASGLIPSNWSLFVKNGVRQDFLEGIVDLAKLDYKSPLKNDEKFVRDGAMIERARLLNAYGSLGFAASLLKAQRQGFEIFPVDSRVRDSGSGIKHTFAMPNTTLLDDQGRHRIGSFAWSHEKEFWVFRFTFEHGGLGLSTRFVCPR